MAGQEHWWESASLCAASALQGADVPGRSLLKIATSAGRFCARVYAAPCCKKTKSLFDGRTDGWTDSKTFWKFLREDLPQADPIELWFRGLLRIRYSLTNKRNASHVKCCKLEIEMNGGFLCRAQNNQLLHLITDGEHSSCSSASVSRNQPGSHFGLTALRRPFSCLVLFSPLLVRTQKRKSPQNSLLCPL